MTQSITSTSSYTPPIEELHANRILALHNRVDITLAEAHQEWILIMNELQLEDAGNLLFCLSNDPLMMNSPVIVEALFDALQNYLFYKLDFTGVTFSDEAWAKLCERLPTALTINALTLPALSADQIAALSPAKQIEFLKMKRVKSDVTAIAKLLASLPITRLILSGCNLTDDHVETLISSLKGKKLIKLNLSGNLITDKGAAHILSHLHEEGCKYLNLERNSIEMIHPFINAYKMTPTCEIKLEGNPIPETILRKFRLWCNNPNESVERLVSSINTSDPLAFWNEHHHVIVRKVDSFTIVSLPMYANDSVRDARGFNAFLEWLRKLSVEKLVLNLECLHFGSELLPLLCSALGDCPIQGLALNGFMLSDQDLLLIARQEWITKITALKLQHFNLQVKPTGLISLNQLLKRASIDSLALPYCGLNDSHLPALLDGVNLERLVEFMFEGNEFSNQFSLGNCPNLKKLELSFNNITSLKTLIDLTAQPQLEKIIANGNRFGEDEWPALFLELKKNPLQRENKRFSIELFSQTHKIDFFRCSLVDTLLQQGKVELQPREFDFWQERVKIDAVPLPIQDLMVEVYQTNKIEGALLERINGCPLPWKDHVYREVLRKQFTIVPIKKDGNCFFGALQEILCSPKTALQLRKEVVDYIRENSDDFAPFFDEGLTLENHLAVMMVEGEWAGMFEMLAASRLFNRPVVLYNSQHHLVAGEQGVLPGADGTIYGELNNNPICLYHVNSNHFDALKK